MQMSCWDLPIARLQCLCNNCHMEMCLDAAEGESDTEIVHAKYVVGADGECNWSSLCFTV